MRQIPVRFLREKSLHDAADGFAVAEDDELAGIFDDGEAASLHFGKKGIASDIALYVADLAADDAALTRGLGAEHVDQPSFG